MASDIFSGKMHTQLIMTIGRYLPTNSQEFKDFKRILDLNRRDKDDNCGSAEDLLEVWQRRGGFGLGNYTNLLWVLKQAHSLNELHQIVAERVAAIEKQLLIESRAGSNPVEQAPDPPDEQGKTILNNQITR